MKPQYRRYILTMAILAVLGFLALFPDLLPFHSRCLFRAVTGIPCPGCGLSRATEALFHGDIRASLWYNPLGIVIDVALVVYVIWYTVDIIRGKDTINALLKRPMSYKVWLPAVIITACNWAFNIYKACYLHQF